MFKKVIAFYNNTLWNATIIAFPRLKTEFINFTNLFTSFDNYLEQHAADIKGFFKSKSQTFLDLVDLTIAASQKAYVWAVDNNKADLIDLFNITKTDLTHSPFGTSFQVIKTLRDAISTNLISLADVNILPIDLAHIDSGISGFLSATDDAGSAKTHKIEGLEEVDDLEKPLMDSLDLIDRLVESNFKISNPALVNEYFSNRNIDLLPTHHTGIHVHITDKINGAELKGAIIAVEGKSATSNINGDAEIPKIKPGTYEVTISMGGYVTQTIKVIFKKGKIQQLNVTLAKQVTPA